MGSYGRNFEFLIVPRSENRLARFSTPSTGTWVMGAPVAGTGTYDDLGREIVEAASEATPPIKGKMGVLVYEYGGGETWAGDDRSLTTYSDKGTAPNSAAVQVVSGPNVKVWFRNTDEETFLESRTYAARKMVATGSTPAVGEYLEPHDSPSDSNGYWRETATLANAWLVVTKVDSDNGEFEAQFLF